MYLAVSIVAYHNGEELLKTIECVLKCKLDLKLFLIDNSKTDALKHLITDTRITYIFNNANLGYGAAHNIAMKMSLEQQTRYHIVMNPDIVFQEGTIEKITEFMDKSPGVGALMPKVYSNDGSVQRLCKLLPTPFDLIGRRFLSGTGLFDNRNKRYELHSFNYSSILNTPCLSGCFMFIRTALLEKTGLFDERFFMYLEDYDLSRRINKIYKTFFFPEAEIVHLYDKGSYKNGSLLKAHIASAIKYFSKWGWLIDKDRTRLNKEVLKNVNGKN